MDQSRFGAVRRQLVADAATPSSHAIRHEEEEIVEEAMLRLSTRDQLVIRLRHREHLSFQEVACRLQITEPAARILWARAIDRLQIQVRTRTPL
jgi:RNA polymerase sigma factor (sigma-70 family)